MIGDTTHAVTRTSIADRILKRVDLAPLTTLEIGGPASQFVEASSVSDVIDALQYARENALATLILGGGSNVLIADRGFDGLVIKIAITGCEFAPSDSDRVIATAGAGETWDALVKNCVEQNLAGIECLSGIPGLVGGTPIQNVGAYGQDVSETITSVHCIDTRTNDLVTLDNSECGFAYRTSIFNTEEKDRYVVTGVKFSLTAGGRPRVDYRDLKDRFYGLEPSLLDVREAVIGIRSEKSMVIRQDDPNRRSAGSFFKNPIVSFDQFADLKYAFPEIPKFPASVGVKVPAAWLIEKAGFAKGHKHGNVGISSKHSLALINIGEATANDLIEFRDLIRDAVHSKFGIVLVQEPVQIGTFQ